MSCLFCGSDSNKLSREHLFRRAFKGSFREAGGLSFSYFHNGKTWESNWPKSQFEIVLKSVCKQCNEGWLNDLENSVLPTLDRLLVTPHGDCLTHAEVRVMGIWAYVRALLRTYISPAGRAPEVLFRRVYEDRVVPKGCYVAMAPVGAYVWEAGAHQAATLEGGPTDGRVYLGFVAFGLGGALFTISISDDFGGEASRMALQIARSPRLWFPNSFLWLAPAENACIPPRVLTEHEAKVCGMVLSIAAGMPTKDQNGVEIDPFKVIPAEYCDQARRDFHGREP